MNYKYIDFSNNFDMKKYEVITSDVIKSFLHVKIRLIIISPYDHLFQYVRDNRSFFVKNSFNALKTKYMDTSERVIIRIITLLQLQGTMHGN